MAANGTALCQEVEALRSKRSQHESDWRDCLDMTFPMRGQGFNGQVQDASNVRAKVAARLDSTGTDSGRTLASAIMSGVTPANSRWFAQEVDDASEEERQWLDDAADTIWQNIHGANFDAAGYESCLDMVGAGWFVLFIDTDREKGGGYAFEQWPIAECFIASTRQDGRPDTIFREYHLSALQAVGYFESLGGTVSDKLRRKALDKPHESVKFLRVIRPRQGAKPEARFARNLPFMSVDIEMEGRHTILERGFHEFPCAIPRWTTIPGSAYAMGPAFDALPDMLELNELVRMEKAAADLALSGMWIAEDDGVLNPRTVKVGPRKIIVANSVDSMKPLNTGGDFQIGFTLKASLQSQIRKVFMADQLQPQDGPQMTATEVHVRVGMIRQLLGPVYGRMQSEYLQPFIERCFGLAYRAGALGIPPESLRGRQFQIRYISPMARAQRLEDVVAMDRLETGILQKREAVPTLMDIYDWEEADRLRGQYLGVPSKLLRSQDDIGAIRKAREDVQAQQQQQQMLGAQTEAAAGSESGMNVMGALVA